jgi:hypothetical protein
MRGANGKNGLPHGGNSLLDVKIAEAENQSTSDLSAIRQIFGIWVMNFGGDECASDISA